MPNGADVVYELLTMNPTLIDKNTKTDEATPLHLAVMAGNLNVIKIIVNLKRM